MNNQSEKIIALLGPTNTGKTHIAVEKMLEFKTGIFGLPLRLLAREIYDKCVHKVGVKKVALIKNIVTKNKDNPEFNEAVSTKKRDDGVEVGNYIIQVVKKKYKSYHIINKLNQDTLFTEIRLYETAYLIVKSLINGSNIDSEEVEDLLDENEEYNEIAKNIWLESRKLRDKSLSSAEKDAVKQTIDRLEDELFDIKTHITSNYNGEFNGEDV